MAYWKNFHFFSFVSSFAAFLFKFNIDNYNKHRMDIKFFPNISLLKIQLDILNLVISVK